MELSLILSAFYLRFLDDTTTSLVTVPSICLSFSFIIFISVHSFFQLSWLTYEVGTSIDQLKRLPVIPRSPYASAYPDNCPGLVVRTRIGDVLGSSCLPPNARRC